MEYIIFYEDDVYRNIKIEDNIVSAKKIHTEIIGELENRQMRIHPNRFISNEIEFFDIGLFNDTIAKQYESFTKAGFKVVIYPTTTTPTDHQN